MTLDGNYFVDIEIEKNKLLAPPDTISFSLRDNIHNVFPVASMNLEDTDGLFSEYLATIIGQKYKIKYGVQETEESLEGEFVVSKEILSEMKQTTIFAGNIDINLIHSWYLQQRKETGAFYENISTIIDRLTRGYQFKKRNIEQTANHTYWYQGKRTQAKFIKDVLLPYSYSANSDNSPFYFFIDLKNNLNFRSYKDMFSYGRKADHEYFYNRQGTKEDSIGNSILDIKRWSEDYVSLNKKRNQEGLLLNTSGNIEKLNIKSEEHLKPRGKQVELIANHVNTDGDYKFLGMNKDISNEVRGMKIHLSENTFYPERYMIMVPMNPAIVSGQTIHLEIYLPNDVNDTYSERVTGKYLIEMTEHVWDGKTSSAVTKMIISRKYAEIPDDYILKGKM